MATNDVVGIALANLQRNVGITGKWKAIGLKELDGQLTLNIDDHKFNFNVEIKQELRNYQLPNIITQAESFKPLIVVANRIFPKIKAELRAEQIAYLEANGNIYIKQNEFMLWVDAQKPIQKEKDQVNRAFTKTGLSVVFHFFMNENFINLPYRQIAKLTEVGLGNIHYVMNGLQEMGFLIKLNKNEYQLSNKKALLNKWMEAYAEKLKPSLKVGTFRFLKAEDFTNWKQIPLRSGKTWWGAEPAGDLFTNHLHPAELTLYTLETRTDLIKNYRLIPDDLGNVKVYKKFWHHDEVNDNVVPPLLIYADLINSNDRRCIETAQKIYDEFLQDKF
ncbi:type IV toxin-antitoxin system AbiEi family antitoxin [Haliscomenobacter hydrossis]|uniref:Uncharacterized protein n=1 Tax=Haliscomenobacter hydrossis (strain ATCC 27775 / DSM 1100 / LMG 10767 / O) TaxID=760192 RepID=F4KRV8_HALH1|nr:type IV toxin-antitoxin system AbiEi family antitoxin [Haliscomenobacter hydrossis]AEE50062.1 Protein of unknown function DUF2186 [Haliscomenobacter hydrossis DSM 1100]